MYGDVPVDFSSGVPQISIPMFKLSDRDIDLDISLSYHASGIKVDQEATWVGLGWALNAGGVITREIRGLPDGYRNGSFLPRTTFPYYNGNIQQNEFSNAGTLLNIAASENGTDNGADVFYYNFNGRAGKFFLDENAKAIFSKYEDLKIEFLNGDYFVITDEKGIRYEFASVENTSNLMGSSLNYISAWYLSKITSPEGGQISFEYVNGGLTNRYYQKRCYDQVYFPMRPTAQQNFPSEYYQTCITRESEIFGIVIKKIINSAGQYIEFVTTPNPRLDAETNINIGNNQLDAVVLYNAQSAAVKKFKFTYSYFEANNSHKISQSTWNFLNYRLRLDALQELSSSGQLQSPYKFEYFGDNDPVSDDCYTLPYRLSPCQDHWGFYNNSNNTIIFPSNPAEKPFHKDEWNLALLGRGQMGYSANPNLGFSVTGGNREPDGEATKAGTLQKITYPTGGHTSLIFEQHETDPNTQMPLSGGLKIKQIETNDGTGHTQTKDYEYYGYSGSGCLCLLMDNRYYTWYNQSYYPGSNGGEYTYSKELVGLGVPPNLAYSNTDIGRVDGTSQLGLGLNVSSPYVQVTERIPGNAYTVYDYTYTEDNNQFYDGLSVPGAYEGTYIKTVNSFLNPPFTHSLTDMSSCVYPFPNFLNNDWRRGHLLSKRVYSENDQLLFEENNTYDIHALKAIQGHKVAKISEYEFFYSRYYQLGGLVKLTRQVSKQYDNNGHFIETIKELEYKSTDHKQLTESKEYTSKGDMITTKYHYPPEYGNVFSFLKEKNILAPVDVRSYRNGKLISGEQVQYNGQGLPLVTYKAETGGSDIPFNPQTPFTFSPKLSNVYNPDNTLRSQTLTNHTPSSYLWGYNKVYPIAQAVHAGANEINYDYFEESGTWPGVSLDNSRSHAGRYSARIDNPYSWELTYVGNKWLNVTLTAATKYKYSAWVYSTGPSADIYFFMKRAGESGPYTYFDGIGTNVRDQWVLVEGEFTVPQDVTQLGIRIDNNGFANGSGSVWFDDIRLHPSAARMTTFTYEPLIGMSSQTDINNRTTYYEYDGFGRLSLVRDQDRNILKKYCYNYLGQPGDCGAQPAQPTQWGNDPIDNVIYYSNNCSGGTPQPYPVSVPAGMFTSTLSPEDANNQAEAYARQQADTYGECFFTLTYANYVNAYGYTVELYNTSTGDSYFFEVGSYGSGGLGDIPAGTYNIYFSSCCDYYYRTFLAGCYYSTSGYGGASFYNVALNASCSNLEIAY